MVKDKSLDIILMALFGIGGIAILIIAWMQPMLTSERILNTFIGSIGILWVLIRMLIRRSIRTRTSMALVTAEPRHEGKQ